jgi:hypothetical protein
MYQSFCPHQGLKPMVECYYGADGHDLIDNMALPARKQFEGLESTTQSDVACPNTANRGIETPRF